MRCKHTDSVANGLPLGIDGMIQMSTLVLLLRPALARLFQLRLMFPWRILSQDKGEWLDVDYILIDFVGPSMMSWLMTVNHQWTGASSEMLRKSFLSLMLLCHRSHLSNLSWDQELLSGSLCYDVVKRRWFWDDAATLDEQTVRISCAREPDTELRACLCMSCRPTCMPKQMLTLSLSSGKHGCVFIWARQKDRTSTLPALQ